MLASYFFKQLKQLELTKNYIYLSILYGLSTLLIPFVVQMLVNNLSLTGLWVSTASFLIIIGIGLFLSVFMKYGQFIITEYLQRKILQNQLSFWFKDKTTKSPYFFEMFSMLKSFSIVCSEGVDFFLTTSFGLVAMALIHPAFLTISLLICLALAAIRYMGKGAVKASIRVSDKKYELYDLGDRKNDKVLEDTVYDYFVTRENFFGFLKLQTLTILAAYVILQMILLTWGIHLIQISELSIGQLVSAEIISTNIFINLSKLPKILKSFYDFETSSYKLEYAKSLGEDK